MKSKEIKQLEAEIQAIHKLRLQEIEYLEQSLVNDAAILEIKMRILELMKKHGVGDGNTIKN